MSVSPGTRLGPYEVLSLLGSGGMGEVYRATDTNLKRQVAIKVLPYSVATDPDRLARFRREAEVLAALNHPNIAHIHGLETCDGAVALVMELVEGPTLADRIAQGPIPISEALPIARQIAEALESAHEHGIVHRDLKPANIKLRADGTAKVLDFGLAKAMEPAGAGAAHNVSMSPTLSMAATEAGLILGTAAYMAPEQAAGKPVDRRADIWSYGVVLWEMLTGRRLFDGETVSHTLADVLRAPIDVAQLPPATPRAIRLLVKRCLDRDVKTRLRDIGEARVAIQQYLANPESDAASTTPASRSSSRLTVALGGLALVLAVALGVLASMHLRESAPSAPLVNTTLLPPDGAEFDFGSSLALPALSPDGTRIVFGARGADGRTQLYIRRLDAATAQPLPGTDDGTFPFWSPDNRWVAFAQGAGAPKLRKIDTLGGPPITIAGIQGELRGGSWNRDGVIIFGTNAGGAIMRVAAAGGQPVPVTGQESRDAQISANPVYPYFLPDGRHFLYTTRQAGDIPIRVASIDEPGKPGAVVAQGNSNAAYADGHLLYLRGSTLMAHPFDPRGLRTQGEAMPLAEGVPTFVQPSRGAPFTVSTTGMLVVQATSGDHFRLVWKDRTGKTLGPLAEAPDRATEMSFSPDGKQLAATIQGENIDLWIFDVARAIPTRFTFSPDLERAPLWSPDGRTIYYSSGPVPKVDLYRKPANGSSPEEVVLSDSTPKYWDSVGPDGRTFIYTRQDPTTRADLWVLTLPPTAGGKPETHPFLQTPFGETYGQISPDGKWVAYQSNETGAAEVYTTSFEGPRGKRQVSSGGGGAPMWRRDGRELYYVTTFSQLMAVDVTERDGSLEFGAPHALFSGFLPAAGMVAPTADGQKFLVSENEGAANGRRLTLLQNWTAALRK